MCISKYMGMDGNLVLKRFKDMHCTMYNNLKRPDAVNITFPELDRVMKLSDYGLSISSCPEFNSYAGVTVYTFSSIVQTNMRMRYLKDSIDTDDFLENPHEVRLNCLKYKYGLTDIFDFRLTVKKVYMDKYNEFVMVSIAYSFSDTDEEQTDDDIRSVLRHYRYTDIEIDRIITKCRES